MKKLISLLVALIMVMSFLTVSADNYENKVYTFTDVATTATFNADGEFVYIDTEKVLRFEDKQVTMNLEGNANNVVLQQVLLTKYDNSEITFTLETPRPLISVQFKNGNFEEVVIEEGAYLLALTTVDEMGAAILILVGEQTVLTEEEISTPVPTFGEEAILSDWAVPEVTEAFDLSLITVELYKNGNYKRNITRGEFAHVMAQLLIQCGVDYDGYVKSLGETPTFKFTDTDGDIDIEFVSSCGIINGMSETEFAPNGELTREQAAAMLSRTVAFLGTKPTIATVSTFNDEVEFSDWAKESIYTVAGLKDKVNNLAVMGGMGEGMFSPKTGYTVEQALIAAKRMLRAVK